MIIPGSEYLTKILHASAQSLLIPVILGLLLFLAFILMELGSFFAEAKRRKARRPVSMMEVFHDVGNIAPWQVRNLQQVIEGCTLRPHLRKSLAGLLGKSYPSKEVRKVVAQDLLDREEFRAKKILSKTDLIAKLGPVLGLMGTLIPLGPGLAALGQGDVKGLSEAVIVAFDTTVAGIAAGAVAAFISKVRRRWYEQDLVQTELLLELVVGGEARVVAEEKAIETVRGGN